MSAAANLGQALADKSVAQHMSLTVLQRIDPDIDQVGRQKPISAVLGYEHCLALWLTCRAHCVGTSDQGRLLATLAIYSCPDPDVLWLQILSAAGHVALYGLDQNTSSWVRSVCKGPLARRVWPYPDAWMHRKAWSAFCCSEASGSVHRRVRMLKGPCFC